MKRLYSIESNKYDLNYGEIVFRISACDQNQKRAFNLEEFWIFKSNHIVDFLCSKMSVVQN